jgi:long-chain fatty acid transport protein
LLPGYQASALGTIIVPRMEPQRGGASRAAVLGGGPIAGSLGGDAASDAFVPATYGTAQVGQDWFVGIGVTSPWGLVTKYGTDFIGRYHALTSELLTMNVAPTVAWRVAPTLSLGAALQVQYAAARLSNAVDFGSAGAISGLGAMGLRPGGADGRATADGTDVALGYQLGLLWEPAAGTRLGLSFRSAVFHELSGDTTFEGVPAPLARAFRSGAARELRHARGRLGRAFAGDRPALDGPRRRLVDQLVALRRAARADRGTARHGDGA